MVGSMFVGSKVCAVVEKATNKDDYKNTGNVELATGQEEMLLAQAQSQQIDQNVKVVAQAQPDFQGAQLTSNLNINENMLTDEQIEKLAYATVFPKYGATNSQMQKYYA